MFNHVYVALESNGYPSKFIRDIQTKKTQPSPNLPPEELVGMSFNLVEPFESRKSFASLPYIKGVTEPLTRNLKKHISVINKPLYNNSSRPRNFVLLRIHKPTLFTKFLAPTVHGVIAVKLAERLTPEEKNT